MTQMDKITVEEIRQKAQQIIDGHYETWDDKKARLRHDAGWTWEHIKNARATYNKGITAMKNLAQRVLAVNPNDGVLYTSLYVEAAANWFGVDVQVDWPKQG